MCDWSFGWVFVGVFVCVKGCDGCVIGCFCVRVFVRACVCNLCVGLWWFNVSGVVVLYLFVYVVG